MVRVKMITKARKELMSALLKRKSELLATGDSIGVTEAEAVRGDDMDIAESMSKQEMSIVMRRRCSEELNMIDEALDKMHKGVYGVCESCEKSIGSKRLKVRPFVKYCIDCQEMMERRKGETAEPVLSKIGRFG